MSARIKKVLKLGGIVAATLLIAIQFVPYGRDHDNPPVTGEPDWDSAVTRQLAVDACFSCHSNETEWPWTLGGEDNSGSGGDEDNSGPGS